MESSDPVPMPYRVAGALMIASGVMNLTMAATLVLSLVWVCVGLLWMPAVLVSVVEITVGAVVLSGRPLRAARWMAMVGAGNGIFCLSPVSVGLQLAAVACQYQEPVNLWLLPHADEPWE